MVIVGIPVVLQNLISLGLNLLDTLMIGMLGEKEIAAVGAANQVYFIFSVSLFGLFSGAAVYTAQYWGAQNLHGVRKVLGIDFMVGGIFSLLVAFIAFFFGENIIGLFSADSEVIELGGRYIRIACMSYFFTAISTSISYNSRAIQNLAIPTAINALALCVNAVLNYILIFGKAGAPALGVEGAAIATLIARIFEFIALILFINLSKNHPFRSSPKELFGFGLDLFKKVMKTAVPVIFTEGGWALSVAVIFAIYGRLGTSALAVIQVTNVATDLLQSIYFGVGNATAMLIGEKLGQRKVEDAYHSGKLAVRTVWVLNVVMTLAMLALAKPIAGIYDFAPDTESLLVSSLMAMGLMITPKMLGYIYIVGILRAGGDTVFSMIIDLACNILVMIPAAALAVMVLGVDLPFAIIMVELSGNLVRYFICMPRYKSRKWINIVA